MASTKPIPMVVDYFGTSDAVITASFHPDHGGWKRHGFYSKTVSVSWLRKLAAMGITGVALSPRAECGQRSAREADFQVSELIRSARKGK